MLRRLLPHKDAFRVISRIANELLDPSNVFVVSYCDQETERHSRLWLDIHGFHDITKVPVGNLFYCRDRMHKNGICQKLGITDFVDDNIKVLTSLETVPTKYLFRTKEKEVKISDPAIKMVRNLIEVEREYF